jgi:antitoxin CptB
MGPGSAVHREERCTASGTRPRFVRNEAFDYAADNSSDNRADILHPERYINPARHVRAFGVRMGINMTGSTRSSGGLDDRRKRLLFRCWHRGTREMDLILGRFADAEIATLSDDELVQLEHLIEVPDPDLYAALTGNVALSPEYASRLFDRIKSFRVADHDA